MKGFLYWILAFLCLAAPCRADLATCIDATCRIKAPDGGVGTGCVFERSNGTVFVLTCAHVVDQASTVKCEFWARGHKSEPLAARVVQRNREVDAAVLALSEASFGGYPPAVVPLAKADLRLANGDTITSVGCAKGAWATAWKGHVLSYSNGPMTFRPTPAQGRSGSAIFDADGQRIVGLLFGQGDCGYASTAAQIRRAFSDRGNQSSKRLNTAGWQPAQCAPGQCPDGQCQSPWPYGGRLLPYRFRQDGQDREIQQRIGQLEQRPVYPTLPMMPQQLPAPQANVDMSRVEDKLDTIASLLQTVIAAGGRQQIPIPETPPPIAEPSKAVDKLAATTEAAVADMKATTEKAVAGLAAEDSRLGGILGTLVGDIDTLPARMAERMDRVHAQQGDDAKLHELAVGYAKDFAGEKLASGELGQSAGYALAGQLGLGGLLASGMGLAGYFASRRVGSRLQGGDTLLTEKLVGMALSGLGLGDDKKSG